NGQYARAQRVRHIAVTTGVGPGLGRVVMRGRIDLRGRIGLRDRVDAAQRIGPRRINQLGGRDEQWGGTPYRVDRVRRHESRDDAPVPDVEALYGDIGDAVLAEQPEMR